MIYTQYGCVVTRVVECNLDNGTAHIVYDGQDRKDYPLIALRADGGMDDIIAEAETVIETKVKP